MVVVSHSLLALPVYSTQPFTSSTSQSYGGSQPFTSSPSYGSSQPFTSNPSYGGSQPFTSSTSYGGTQSYSTSTSSIPMPFTRSMQQIPQGTTQYRK